MKWYWWISRKVIGLDSVILVALSIGVFVLLVEFPDLNIIFLKEVIENWQWTEWHPWIIVVYFFWIYLAIGIDLGITWQGEHLKYLRYLAKYKNDKRRFLFVCTYFQIFLSGISWPLLGLWQFMVGEGSF